MDPRILAIFILLSTQLSHAENPGLKIRISQKGLDYVAGQAVRVLKPKVLGGSRSYSVTKYYQSVGYDRLSINYFNVPQSSITVAPSGSIKWTLDDASIVIGGRFWFEGSLGIVNLPRVESYVRVDVYKVKVSVSMGMSVSRGRPTITGVMCTASIGKIGLNINALGIPRWLLQITDPLIVGRIKDYIIKTIIKKAREAIMVNAAEALATLEMTVPIGGDAILNYPLISQPTFTSSYIESYHKAEVTWKGDPAPSSVKAPPMPDTTSNHMISFWLSDYLMNTLGDVTYRHGTLEKTLTANDLGENEKWLLNTNCPEGYCIGTAIRSLAEKFPDTSVALEMSASSRPRLVIKENTLQGLLAGIVKYNVLLPDGSFKYVMTTKLNLNVTLNVTLTGTNLTAAITNHSFLIHVSDMIEELGYFSWLSTIKLFPICNAFVHGYIIPKFNELGAKGFPLPKIKYVKYVNPRLTIEKGLLGIMTDVKYDPSY